jgi:hypothetical protein
MCRAFRIRNRQKIREKSSIKRDAAMVFGGAVAGCVLSLSIVFSISERRIEPDSQRENYHFIADPNFSDIRLGHEDAGQSCDSSRDDFKTKLDQVFPMTIDPLLLNSKNKEKQKED